MKVDIHSWDQARTFACHIRREVFIQEQQVPEEMEWDTPELEAQCIHALAWASPGQAVGYARLLPNRQIGRMAVLSGYRRQGIGHALLTALEDEARKHHMETVFLHAQTRVKKFYLHHGFEPEGNEFDEAGILHIKMTKTL